MEKRKLIREITYTNDAIESENQFYADYQVINCSQKVIFYFFFKYKN